MSVIPMTSSREAMFIVLIIIASFVLSITAPLLTYSTGLAIFGLAHVLLELRFVDQRFSARMPKSLLVLLGVLLLGIVCTRSAMVFKLLPANIAYTIELSLVFLLAVSAQAHLAHARPCIRIFTSIIIAILGLGLLISPLSTVVVLAVLHNLTPMGFIVEIVPRVWKRLAFFACCICFLLLPFLISIGLFQPLFELWFGKQHDVTIFPTGPLKAHLAVFLPEWFRQQRWAVNGFSAIAFAQCMHYVAVIYVMPRLMQRTASSHRISKPLIPWPKAVLLGGLVIAATFLLVTSYLQDFRWTRSLYGIAASLHAYLEIPVLLWACGLISTSAIKVIPKASMPNLP